jgi:selenocysteine lyase/cysteine desulfurase
MSVSTSYLNEFSEPIGYIDFAAMGPPSLRVRNAVAEAYARASEPEGPVGPVMLGRYEAALARCGRFLGVEPELVTTVPNTSTALFHVAFGIAPFGGNIVVPSHEFPTNLYPWLRAAGMGGPEVRMIDVPDRRVTAGALSDAVDDETRAIAVSAVDYLSGFRPDLGALRELADDALLVVDAAQGLGGVVLDLSGADVIAATGVKWLRAGFGSGLMAVSSRAIEMLHSTLTGWWGVEDSFDWDELPPHRARDDAERFHDGGPSFFAAAAMAAAVDIIESEGMVVIDAAVMENARAIEDVVRQAGGVVLDPWSEDAERSGIVSFQLADEPATVTMQRLDEAEVTVSLRGDWLRAAPHASTDPAVFDVLAEVLDGES